MILLLSISSKASSITDTLPSRINLTPVQAIGVIKDLVSYDGLKEIVKLQESQIADLRTILRQKDTIIASHERSALKYDQINLKTDVIIQAQETKYKDLNRKYVRAVRWGRFKVVLLPVVGVAGLYAGAKLFK